MVIYGFSLYEVVHLGKIKMKLCFISYRMSAILNTYIQDVAKRDQHVYIFTVSLRPVPVLGPGTTTYPGGDGEGLRQILSSLRHRSSSLAARGREPREGRSHVEAAPALHKGLHS